MIIIISKDKLLQSVFKKICLEIDEVNSFYIWKAACPSIKNEAPKLIIYHLPTKLTEEKEFLTLCDTPPHIARPKLLLISDVNTVSYLPFCHKNGVEGLVDFACDMTTLEEIIHKILNGQKHLAQSPRQNFSFPFGLSQKEWELAFLLLANKPKKSILSILDISVRTFERRKNALFQKCDSKNEMALLRTFQRLGHI